MWTILVSLDGSVGRAQRLVIYGLPVRAPPWVLVDMATYPPSGELGTCSSQMDKNDITVIYLVYTYNGARGCNDESGGKSGYLQQMDTNWLVLWIQIRSIKVQMTIM